MSQLAQLNTLKKRIVKLGFAEEPLIYAFPPCWCGYWKPGFIEAYLQEDLSCHPPEGLERRMALSKMRVLTPWPGCPYDAEPIDWGLHGHAKTKCDGESCPHYSGKGSNNPEYLQKLVDSCRTISAEN